jgi:hypothetical protein
VVECRQLGCDQQASAVSGFTFVPDRGTKYS